MERDDEPLALRLIKHPLVWSGTGLLVRYAGEPTTKASLWTGLGVLSLAVGVGHAIATRPSPSVGTTE